jgi:hypothetical protein
MGASCAAFSYQVEIGVAIVVTRESLPATIASLPE